MGEWVDLTSKAIQGLAVIIIVISVTFGSVRFLVHLGRGMSDPYRAYKTLLGRALLLSLEFLVAADVIRTVLFDLTAKGMEILAALVAIRTFLSWSVVVEVEGHWPWQAASDAALGERVGGQDAGRSSDANMAQPDQRALWAIELPFPPTAGSGNIPGDPQRIER